MQGNTFDTLQLSQEVRKAMTDLGFTEPTPIQAQSIPPILEGKDVIGQAQTGTGKTAAFGIPILHAMKQHGKKVEALVLCPTRELAVQVSEELRKLARYRRDVTIIPVYGGQPIQGQMAQLRRGVRIVVGTPGRTIDHMNRGTLKLGNVKTVVLDEADEMLDMGFLPDMETILGSTSADRQTLLFSATMPRPILELARKYQKEPTHVNVAPAQLTVPQVEQTYLQVRPGAKLDVLCRLIDTYQLASSLIFCNTKRRVDEVAKDLRRLGYQADRIHGDMTQAARTKVMTQFRWKQSRILVATDVAARGIDVKGIDAVINYDVPRDDQFYVHRIGRTARMGRSGRAFTLVLPSEMGKLRDIEAYAKTRIKRHPLLSGRNGEGMQRRDPVQATKDTQGTQDTRKIGKGPHVRLPGRGQ